MKEFKQAALEGTCQKRLTITEIYTKEGELLSRESNRCSPTGGVCHRLDVKQDKSNYDTETDCNWRHSEIKAIEALPKKCSPYYAICYGHSFICDNCEQHLRAVGVQILSTQLTIPE